MAVAAKTGLTPPIRFWGVHPDDPAKLGAGVLAKRPTPSPQVRTLLERYYTLIPRNNAEFLSAAGGEA